MVIEAVERLDCEKVNKDMHSPNVVIAHLYQDMIDIAKSGPEGVKTINDLVSEPLLSARLARLEAGNQYTKGFKLLTPNGHQILDETPYAIGLAAYLCANLMDMIARGSFLEQRAVVITSMLEAKLGRYTLDRQK